ncbi:ribosomal protein L34e-domain-containing protein [Lipomyces japonicus]|uniref:60S ribosomal protein eL34 n=1 Tax=Lipomyces japonicus TaxID=56871 RepID=UPI0034CF5816
MAQRLAYRKRNPYNTRSNKVKIVKTPGGKLVYQHVTKTPSRAKCGGCELYLPGIPSLRPRKFATISKPQKTVQRAYGGVYCSKCVRERIVRAFLVEEQKIVKKVVKSTAAAAPKAEKPKKKSK